MARRYDPRLAEILEAERALALRALSVEREGVPNPRKDLRKSAGFPDVYGFFFPQIFEPVTDPADARFGGLARTWRGPWRMPSRPATSRTGRAPGRTPSGSNRSGLAADSVRASQKVYKQDPDAYPGSIADASQVIRVLITGARKSPDLAEVARALGTEEVLRRVRAVSAS